ncbi:MAG: hypothetical protein JXA66_06625, partial [Oligoflexia bacterium]|nr:hypothetical protein [Oligoflexia bacterium]
MNKLFIILFLSISSILMADDIKLKEITKIGNSIALSKLAFLENKLYYFTKFGLCSYDLITEKEELIIDKNKIFIETSYLDTKTNKTIKLKLTKMFVSTNGMGALIVNKDDKELAFTGLMYIQGGKGEWYSSVFTYSIKENVIRELIKRRKENTPIRDRYSDTETTSVNYGFKYLFSPKAWERNKLLCSGFCHSRYEDALLLFDTTTGQEQKSVITRGINDALFINNTEGIVFWNAGKIALIANTDKFSYVELNRPNAANVEKAWDGKTIIVYGGGYVKKYDILKKKTTDLFNIRKYGNYEIHKSLIWPQKKEMYF